MPAIMGFADLSIADIAAEYRLAVSDVMQICTRLDITYRDEGTNLALEDAKAVMLEILGRAQDPAEGDCARARPC
ncbi:translation initiation factor IF-2 [Rubidibacter lacunae]|nr:translation initiation factor IF-2 [Rubidibacter lacunae]